MAMVDWRRLAPPMSFDSEELVDAFTDTVLQVHDTVESTGKCFTPHAGEDVREHMRERVRTVVLSAFMPVFDLSPEERFEDIFAQASYFAIHLAADHCFYDGNKRTALLVALTLVHLMPISLDFDDEAEPENSPMYRWIQEAVSRKRSQDELAAELRSRASLLPDDGGASRDG